MNALLIHGGRLTPSPSDQAAIAASLRSDLDWDLLVRRSGEEGVASLLYLNLKEHADKLPPSHLAKLKNAYVRNTARNLYVFKKITPFLEALSARNLRIAVTRGARLAETVYQDWGLRAYVDVDFMVHPADTLPLVDVLKSLGYWEGSFASRFPTQKVAKLKWIFESGFQKDGVNLDFHFYYPGVEVSLDAYPGLWEMTTSMRIFESDVRIFSAEYELCILCVHAMKHCYTRIVWLTDIAELSLREELDWEKVCAICREQGISPPVYYALFLVNRFWPDCVPASVLQDLYPGRRAARMLNVVWPSEKVAAREIKEDIPGHAAVAFLFFSGRRLGLKFKTLLAATFPPRAYVAYFYQIPVNSIRMVSHYAWRVRRPFSLLMRMLRKRS